MRLPANASRTAPVDRAVRSLTRQVMHHAAVMLTNTGCPEASSASSFCWLNASDGTFDAADWTFAPANRLRSITRTSATTPAIEAAAMPLAARAETLLSPSDRLKAHAANAISTSAANAASKPDELTWKLRTQISQATVA